MHAIAGIFKIGDHRLAINCRSVLQIHCGHACRQQAHSLLTLKQKGTVLHGLESLSKVHYFSGS